MKYFALLITCWGFTVSSFSPALLQRSHNQITHLGGTISWRQHDFQYQQDRITVNARAVPTVQAHLISPSSIWRDPSNDRFTRLHLVRARLVLRIRRILLIVFMAFVLWSNGVCGLSNIPTSHAASIESVTVPIFHEKSIDNYVKNHMFDDERYDAVASTYREANFDKSVGSHASALREVTTSIVGESGKRIGRQAERGGSPVASALMALVSVLEKRGMSEMSAIILLTTIVFAGAPMIFLVGSMSISLMFKRGIVREMKARYGESYTIDATIKKDEEIEAPPDDDDDNEDDDTSTGNNKKP